MMFSAINLSAFWTTRSTAENSQDRTKLLSCRLFLPLLYHYFYKGAFICGVQIAVISDTEHHVTPSHLSDLSVPSTRHVSLSPSFPASQVESCSCSHHMMSCGPAVEAEQGHFYPFAIWSTRCCLSHAHIHTHACARTHAGAHTQTKPVT